jgi:hypothetical protein
MMEFFQWPVKKKVYCINCVYYKKEKVEKRARYYRCEEIDWNYITSCIHPKNLEGEKTKWDSYERKHCHFEKPKHPRWLNGKNKCKWFKDMGAQGVADWEV